MRSKDESPARSLYDQMVGAMQQAESLYYQSEYWWEARDREIGHCTYQIWMKKPNYARVEATTEGELRGVLVGDGDFFWVFWPSGRPNYGFEDPVEYERTRFTSYMRQPAPQGRHSIAHQAGNLGAGMGMTIVNPSTFHGCAGSLDPYLDGVKGMGTERVGEEECDLIEVSFMNHQRSKYLWLSRRDHLPRKLKEVVRVSHDITAHELWSNVALNLEIDSHRFSWQPPEDWQEWRLPPIEQGLLKAGAEAPDFELSASDGTSVRLSDFRGKVVWLAFWRVGCPPCRQQIPDLEALHREYGQRGLAILGFNCADAKQIALDFLQANSVTFPNILDPSEAARAICWGGYETLQGMGGVPLNYIIDRDGKVADAWYGHDKERGIRAFEKLEADLKDRSKESH